MSAGRRHIPLRTCVVCGNKTEKRDLTRIVATAEGMAEVDPSGKMPGRGAYVCRDGKCVRVGLSRRRLEYALRTRLDEERWADVTGAVAAAATPG